MLVDCFSAVEATANPTDKQSRDFWGANTAGMNVRAWVAPTSTSAAPVRQDFFSFIVTSSLQSGSRTVHVHVRARSRISPSLFTTHDTPRGTYKLHSPWLPWGQGWV
jgi:hypothetical protein